MSPDPSVYHLQDRLFADMVLVGKTLKGRLARGVFGSNRAGRIFSQFRCMVLGSDEVLWSSRSALLKHVECVIFREIDKQVQWVRARCVIAGVADKESDRNSAFVQFVRNAMCADHLVGWHAHSHVAVPAVNDTPAPFPARILVGYIWMCIFPETVYHRLRHGHVAIIANR